MQDQTVAGMVCQALEQEHIPCWIAPRNVPAGDNAFDAIPVGMARCTVLVLILSESATKSKYVQRELQLALHHKKVIIPFRIEDVKLGGAVDFMLTGVQWLDAFVPPMERHIASLVNRVAAILNAEGERVPAVRPIEEPAAKHAVAKPTATPAVRRQWKEIAAGAAAVVICIAAYLGYFRQSDASVHAAVVQRLQAALNPHGILIDCPMCGVDQAHVDVFASAGFVQLTGRIAPADEALVHGVSLDVKGVRAVSYFLQEIPSQQAATPANTAPAHPAAVSVPARSASAVAKPADRGIPAVTPAATAIATPAPAPVLTAEQYRARAAVLTGQQKMQDRDYVSAENYFRLALNLDPGNQAARTGLDAALKALGEN